MNNKNGRLQLQIHTLYFMLIFLDKEENSVNGFDVNSTVT